MVYVSMKTVAIFATVIKAVFMDHCGQEEDVKTVIV